MSPSASAIQRFRDAFAMEALLPDDDGFDDARSVWNAVYGEPRPALMLRPSDASQVAAAIAFGREHDLPIAIRCGGHTGQATVQDGLVIDLARMRRVSVDAGERIARVGGGSLLRDLDRAAQAHGLVCPTGVVGHTGVGGLTLGGGTGRLQRRFGLTIDNLRAVELVTADGRHVRASATEEPDLFWAMRGAGANFGVVTQFEFQLQAFDGTLYRRLSIYPASQAQEAWATFAAFAEVATDEVSAIFVIGAAEPASEYPDEVAGKPVVVIGVNYAGPADTMERDLRPLERGPSPVTSTDTAVRYLAIQGAEDDTRRWGRRNYILGHASRALSAESIDGLLEHAAAMPHPECEVAVMMLGGAMGRVPAEATAFPAREAPFDFSAEAAWDEPVLDEASRAWCREALTIVQGDLAPGRYVGEVMDTGPEITRSIYGDAILRRLALLKATWDPDNVFRLNHNVTPQA
jgi:FAD/FMN-containing dehydrogenase